MRIDASDLLPKDALSHSILGESPDISLAGRTILQSEQLCMIFLGLAAITCILFLLWNITKLGSSGGEDKARKSAQAGVLFSGVALALLGGLSIFLRFLWNVL